MKHPPTGRMAKSTMDIAKMMIAGHAKGRPPTGSNIAFYGLVDVGVSA